MYVTNFSHNCSYKTEKMKNQIETDYKGKQIMKENKQFSKYDCVLQTLHQNEIQAESRYLSM